MAAYRVYRVDGTGKFVTAEWIEADTDEEALQIAEALEVCPPCEVWQRDRFVGRVGFQEAG